ncbi:MAG: sulfur carrier protein ThiS [Pirellulales bacterium]
MEIVVNGRVREVAERATVATLLNQLDVTAPGVAVEVNHELIPRSHHADHVLEEGDRLEVVTLVGGG